MCTAPSSSAGPSAPRKGAGDDISFFASLWTFNVEPSTLKVWVLDGEEDQGSLTPAGQGPNLFAAQDIKTLWA